MVSTLYSRYILTVVIGMPQRTRDNFVLRRKAFLWGRRLLLIGAAAAFGACEQPTSFFTEYRDINLIRDAGVDNEAWKVVADTAGGEEVDTLEDYVRVTPVEPDGAAGDTGDDGVLPIGSTDEDIRRIEILNLFPNGDFDDDTVITNWVSSDGGTNAERLLVSDPDASVYVIDGNSLNYDIEDQEEWIQYPLSGENGLTDGLAGDLYTLRFDLRTDRENVFGYFTQDLLDEWSLQRDWFTTTLSGNVQGYVFGGEETQPDAEFNLAQKASGVEHYLTLGAPEPGANADLIPISGSLDNVRVARSDIAPRLQLLVPVTGNDYGPLDLPSGMYRFSVYLRTDPTHTNDFDEPSDNVANRFPAERVTLSMAVRETGRNRIVGSFHQAVAQPGSEESWTSWTEVSVSGFLQTSDADYSDNALEVELTISPTDLSFPSGVIPGSVLVAQPRLELLSE